MKLKLIAINKEIDDASTFIFETPKTFKWVPGQYCHVILPHANQDDRGEERWFTISSAPCEKHISITTRFFGAKSSSFKKKLFSLKPGESIWVDSPEGDFVIEENNKNYVFIVGGIGITPIRSILKQLTCNKQNISGHLLYINSSNNFVYDEEIKLLANSMKMSKFYQDKKIDNHILLDYAKDKNALFYISGPRAMVVSYRDKLLEMGIDSSRIKIDFFPGY
jgi:ferredoxin-NADP reductase